VCIFDSRGHIFDILDAFNQDLVPAHFPQDRVLKHMPYSHFTHTTLVMNFLSPADAIQADHFLLGCQDYALLR